MQKPIIAALALGVVALSALGNAQNKSLNLFIWSEYIDPALVKSFEKANGAKINISLYESMEDMLGKLRTAGNSSYDLIVPSQYIVPTLIGQKLVRELDKTKLPNFKNIAKRFVNPSYDPGNKYSAAYQWGTTGIAYNKEKVKNPEKTWGLMFDAKKQPGPFVMMDDSRVMIGAALKYLGKPYNSVNPEDLKQALVVLQDAKKRALGFDGSPGGRNKISAGQAVLAVVYNGDALRGQSDDPNIDYFFPKEGGEVWVDSLMVTKNAKNPDLAHKFINYILDAKNGAQLSNWSQYASPNEAAKAQINAKDRSNPIIYPADKDLAKAEFALDLGANLKLYDSVWTRVKR